MATSTTDVCRQIYMKKIVLIVKKKNGKKTRNGNIGEIMPLKRRWKTRWLRLRNNILLKYALKCI